MQPILRFLSVLLLLGGWVLAPGCSSTSSHMEDAKFLLDQAKFSDAIAILQPLVDSDATNYQAMALLARAYFARGFLGDETTLLGLFADVLESEDGMKGVRGFTPAAAADGASDVYAAIGLFEAIPTGAMTTRDYLAYALTQMAILSVVGVGMIGAIGNNNQCSYDYDAPGDDDVEQYENALDGVSDNFVNSGYEDFKNTGLYGELQNMSNGLKNAGDFETYLKAQYNFDECP